MKLDFLYGAPMVCAIGREYEIILAFKECGIASVKIGGEVYYEENSGIIPSTKRNAKIRVPMEALDKEKHYTVGFRRTIDKKPYYPIFGSEELYEYGFRPLEKEDGINVYHLADVHYKFDTAISAAYFFGEELDLLIVNGDIGESEREENYLETIEFVGRITKGEIPVVFVRGNHDTRGAYSDRYADYFPANGKKTYFDFEIGPFYGIALDLGEDKPDEHIVYNGTNIFAKYRRDELEFLKKLCPSEKRYRLAVSHICPAKTTKNHDSEFNIERELYAEWMKELERLKVEFMLAGHLHTADVSPVGDESCTIHNFCPVVTGSKWDEKMTKFYGAALTFKDDLLSVRITDATGEVSAAYEVNLKIFEVNKTV